MYSYSPTNSCKCELQQLEKTDLLRMALHIVKGGALLMTEMHIVKGDAHCEGVGSY